ncbi:hypothetical protein EHS25_003641 [Saitozyma podzolica]|uniref:Major facilitator superfamily (MFS) profile domain-containing protein n=1 Tax=Saitozyma podzolica TaxID=1890683 RepID=A0A427Y7T4_9TREE|nr:hypothetical protein EHS25_003641 [Saitozyma podzolica]
MSEIRPVQDDPVRPSPGQVENEKADNDGGGGHRLSVSKSVSGAGDTVVVEPADKEGKLDQAAIEAMIAEGEVTKEDYDRVKRRVDWILLPLMWWMYGIQQTDKTGLGTMNIFGLQKDTGMVGKQYSYLTVMFYVSYAVFETPNRADIDRLHAFFTNWAEFMAFRFIQGALECTISPGFNVIIARWYTKREHSSRSLVFQSANAGWGIIVNLVFYGIAKHSAAHPGGFAAWRGIEVFLGAQTLVASVIAWFLLGTPSEVRWLDHKQKVTATARVMVNHAGTDLTGTGGWSWSQTREAFLDPVLYFQFAITFLCCVVNGAITTFGTVIETGFGFDPYQVLLLECVRNAFSVIWFVFVGYSSLKIRHIRMYWMMLSTVIPFIALLVIALLPTQDQYRWTKMVMYWGTAIFVIPSFSAWALISSNTAGRTKISVISATTFIGYCTGNIAGSQTMPPKDAPHYIPGTIACAACMGGALILIVLWRFWLVYQNRKKDEEVAAMGLTKAEEERRGQELGAQDVTDLKNPFFKYDM